MNGDLDDVEHARELLAGGAGEAGAGCVLFDFDGPLCRLFPLGSSMRVADELRRCVESFGALDVLCARERTDKDPHVVLRAVHRARRDRELGDLPERLEELVARGELNAARTAWPTPQADDLVRWLADRGARLAVVTNNAPRAVDFYLRAHGLRQYFEGVHGRTADPGLMKPHPDVIERALRGLGLSPGDAVMIGDTPTDVEAAERAGVPFIGYGRNAEKRARLRNAGAKAVLGSYGPLLQPVGEGDADADGPRM
ncbi:HAD family hydrolase [Streptomyces sp. NPDC003247]|uniref:HAD family hydrolase n=1 Tax=Streptomyces sp. NPDC003247 TaxID=3364677 RepID=UPI0036763CC1